MTTTDQLDARIEDLRRQLAEAEAERERQNNQTVGQRAAEALLDVYKSGGKSLLWFHDPRPSGGGQVIDDPARHLRYCRECVAAAIDQSLMEQALAHQAQALAARPASPAPADLPSAEDVAERFVSQRDGDRVLFYQVDPAPGRVQLITEMQDRLPRVPASGLIREEVVRIINARDAYWQAKVADATREGKRDMRHRAAVLASRLFVVEGPEWTYRKPLGEEIDKLPID